MTIRPPAIAPPLPAPRTSGRRSRGAASGSSAVIKFLLASWLVAANLSASTDIDFLPSRRRKFKPKHNHRLDVRSPDRRGTIPIPACPTSPHRSSAVIRTNDTAKTDLDENTAPEWGSAERVHPPLLRHVQIPCQKTTIERSAHCRTDPDHDPHPGNPDATACPDPGERVAPPNPLM